MDTYKKYRVYDDFDREGLVFARDQDAFVFHEMVLLDSALQGIEQLNQMFRFNVLSLAPYELRYDDYVIVRERGKTEVKVLGGDRVVKKLVKDIDGKKVEIKVYSGKRVRTNNDKEMDERAKTAVRAAISKAKVCKQPIAQYDASKKKPYIEYPNGEKVYE